MSMVIGQQKSFALAGLGKLLEYPTAGFQEEVAQWRREFSPLSWVAGSHVAEFQKAIEPLSLTQLEELYTRTFDMSPICNPYITAHLYGDENFERGNVMTKLGERYEQENFDRGGELPDHLRVMLSFAPYFSDEELKDVIEYLLLTPVKRMRDSLEGQSNPYYPLLQAVLVLLQSI